MTSFFKSRINGSFTLNSEGFPEIPLWLYREGLLHYGGCELFAFDLCRMKVTISLRD